MGISTFVSGLLTLQAWSLLPRLGKADHIWIARNLSSFTYLSHTLMPENHNHLQSWPQGAAAHGGMHSPNSPQNTDAFRYRGPCQHTKVVTYSHKYIAEVLGINKHGLRHKIDQKLPAPRHWDPPAIPGTNCHQFSRRIWWQPSG